MHETGARPPPTSCRRVLEAIESSGSSNLVEYREIYPLTFNALLAHAQDCPDCRAVVLESFPNGFSSSEGRKRLEGGLQRAAEVLGLVTAEEHPVHDDPLWDLCTEPRGGSGD